MEITNKFALAGIDYDDCSASVGFRKKNDEIILTIEVKFQTESSKIPFELSEGSLYHENGFQTKIKNFEDLVGSKFTWTTSYNEHKEEAGVIYLGDHIYLNSGTIEILNVTKEDISIKWSGKADVDWTKKFGKDVPFDAEFQAKLPTE